MIPKPPKATNTTAVINPPATPRSFFSSGSLVKPVPQRLQNLSPGVTGPPQAEQYMSDPFVGV
jgi:hypothetical protein